MWSQSTNVTDRQTDGRPAGQTDYIRSQYRSLHYSKKHCTASQLLQEFANINWSRRWLNHFRKKVINLVLFGADHAVIVHWCRAVAASQHALRPGRCSRHRLWTFFWLKLALITFISTSTAAVDNSTLCSIQTFVLLWNCVPFWCCCVTAQRAFHFAK